jgi:hypothetical protein
MQRQFAGPEFVIPTDRQPDLMLEQAADLIVQLAEPLLLRGEVTSEEGRRQQRGVGSVCGRCHQQRRSGVQHATRNHDQRHVDDQGRPGAAGRDQRQRRRSVAG